MGIEASSLLAVLVTGAAPVELPTLTPSQVPVAPELINARLVLADTQSDTKHVWRPRRPGRARVGEEDIGPTLVPVSFVRAAEEFPALIAEDHTIVTAPAPELREHQGVRRYPRQQDQ